MDNYATDWMIVNQLGYRITEHEESVLCSRILCKAIRMVE